MAQVCEDIFLNEARLREYVVAVIALELLTRTATVIAAAGLTTGEEHSILDTFHLIVEFLASVPVLKSFAVF